MRMVRLPQSRTLLYDLLPHALPRVPGCATGGSRVDLSMQCFVGSTMHWLWHDGVDWRHWGVNSARAGLDFV